MSMSSLYLHCPTVPCLYFVLSFYFQIKFGAWCTKKKIFFSRYETHYHLHAGYVDDLFAKLWTLIEGSKADSTKLAVSPPPLCSSFKKPDKDTAIAKHKTRFSKQ